ncbi:LacI family DNA-binding transcriptional regulator [Nocardioides sp.]|uniref:LacI family DNA-binding transcriptional regulator n=1 Tax=Nocardioides sp. TaxID=35761 RepID=UPI00262F1A6C|nr:LacI family DNA-binding transcriptional regulator [Nocardioides sp.]MDI6911721.1 LacI family DNA-binding transcriptional regulator [Nocardioides sp.]
MRQVADRAGVAMSSVSRVLNNHPDVSESMRARVMTAVEEFGYEPNAVGQMLRQGATKTVGFVVGDISNHLQAEIALGAELALEAQGYTMLLMNSVNNPQLDAEHIRLLIRRQVDGLLLSVADETHRPTIEALEAGNTPYVLIDRELDAQSPPWAVTSDHRGGITSAVEELVGLGHRRIALVGGSPHVRPTRERVAAIEEAVARYPDVSCQVRSGAFTEGHGAAATRELLEGKLPPTAIIAGGNQILIGVLREIRGRALAIPRDLSLVTCDRIPLAEFLSPSLSTIYRDPVAMGRAAAELLLAQLAGQPAQVITLPATYERAGSCSPSPDAVAPTHQ